MAERDPIETLRALLSEATPGPWVDDRGGFVLLGYEDRDHRYVCEATVPADATAIAALRNLAPELLAVVEAAGRLRPVVSDAGLLDAPATFVDDDAAADLVSRLRDLRAKAAEALR